MEWQQISAIGYLVWLGFCFRYSYKDDNTSWFIEGVNMSLLIPAAMILSVVCLLIIGKVVMIAIGV